MNETGSTISTFPNMTVGVMGSAGGDLAPDISKKVRVLGSEIARRGCPLVTGAAPGLPHEAVLGAKQEGGLVVGILPALNLHEHVTRYRSPTRGYDVIVYTGSGLMGREIENIRTCDVVIFVGGRSGTLGEFAIAYDEGKVIGLLDGTGGITAHLETIIEKIDKDTGAIVQKRSDPAELLDILEFCYRRDILPGYLEAMEGHEPDGTPEV